MLRSFSNLITPQLQPCGARFPGRGPSGPVFHSFRRAASNSRAFRRVPVKPVDGLHRVDTAIMSAGSEPLIGVAATHFVGIHGHRDAEAAQPAGAGRSDAASRPGCRSRAPASRRRGTPQGAPALAAGAPCARGRSSSSGSGLLQGSLSGWPWFPIRAQRPERTRRDRRPWWIRRTGVRGSAPHSPAPCRFPWSRFRSGRWRRRCR